MSLRHIRGFKNKILYILNLYPFCTKHSKKYGYKCIKFKLKNGACMYCGATKNY